MLDMDKSKIIDYSQKMVNNWPITIFICYLFGFILLQFPDIIVFGIIDYPLHYYIIFGLVSIIVMFLILAISSTYNKLQSTVYSFPLKRININNKDITFILDLSEVITTFILILMTYWLTRTLSLDPYLKLLIYIFYISLTIKVILFILKTLQIKIKLLTVIYAVICIFGFYISINGTLLNYIKINYLQKSANIITVSETYSNAKIICVNSDFAYIYDSSLYPLIINKDLIQYIDYKK